MKPTIAGWLWYRGDRFRGFQRQVQGPTVQEALERALDEAGVGATPLPAGRTDRGVHARMQVVGVRLPEGLSAEELERRLRALLPADLGVCAIRRAPPGFHPQWRCAGKEYRYRFALGPPRPEWERFCWRVDLERRCQGSVVAPERVDELLRRCVGRRDFWAFHEKSSVRRERTLASAELVELGGGLFEARLSGEGFARYQVRYLVGSALAVAAGAVARSEFEAALDRAEPFAGLKAPGEGLVLWEVFYPRAVDPFSEDRKAPPHLPAGPPFQTA